MKFYILLTFCLITPFLFCQLTCKGILIDKVTHQPVEFANIGVIGKGIGTVSNEKGEYKFIVPDSLAGENIRVSMIGYNSRTYSIRDFQKQSTIELSQNATILKEIPISVKKLKIRIEGNDTRSKSIQAGFKNNSLGAELGVRIAVRHKQTQIRKVMFCINRNTLDTLPVFRFNVYKEQNGMPGENILTQNIIITPKEKTGFIEFDLRPYGIFTNEDVFITLEWIKDLGDVTGLFFSTKLVGNATYYRQTSQDKWQKIPAIGIGIHAEIAY